MSPWIFHIELPILGSWHTVEVLRTTLLNCLATVFESQTYCETLGMISAELLENAIKYGQRIPTAGEPAFRLKVTGTKDRVEIAVSNPVDRASPGLDRLFALLADLAVVGAAERVYLEKLRAVAADPTAQGGLGLARIVYESGCSLTAVVGPNGVLEVKAVSAAGVRVAA